MSPLRHLAVLCLALAVSASPDGYTDPGVTPVPVSPSPGPYRPRSPDDNIFSGSGAVGVGGGYFPAVAAGSGGGGRVISLGGGGGGRRVPSGAPQSGGEGMPYDFGWAVQEPDSGNEFTHEETSDGVLTSGQYRVNLPDGRVQLVTYTVRGDSGYQAEVTYEGEAQYPPTPAGQGYTGAGQQSYSAASGGQQSYSSPSSGQQRYSAASSGQRYSSGSGSRPAFSAAPAPSRGFPNRAGRRYNSASAQQTSRAPSTQYGAAPSPRPSTEYGAAPAAPRYTAARAGQASSAGFGSRLALLAAGVSYRGAESTSPQLESTYGAPAAPSQSYGI